MIVNSLQFLAYKSISINDIYDLLRNKPPYLEDLQNLMKLELGIIKLSSISNPTQEHANAAIIHKRTKLYDIPQHLRNGNIYYISVKRNGLNIRLIPRELITPEICLMSVIACGWSIQYVPKELLTLEMCKIAISYNPSTFLHIPPELLTKELCLLAVTRLGYNIDTYH